MKLEFILFLVAAILLLPGVLQARIPTLNQVRRAFGVPTHVRCNTAVLTGKSAAHAALMRDKMRSRINAAERKWLDYDPMTQAAFAGEERFGQHGVVTRLNADLLTEGTYREALTTYVVGYPSQDYLPDLNILAPGVQVANRFSYKAFDNAEAFYSELQDDLRPPRADFKEVEFTSDEVLGQTSNRGLMVSVDRDQVRGNPNWEQQYTLMLTKRIRLNQLRRAIALLSAGSINTGVTWDASASQNPDGNVRSTIKFAHTAAGVRPNRVAYGPTAWDDRVSTHEAQNNPGGYAAAGRTPVELAQYLNVDHVLICQARYSTSATAKAEALANLVMMFNAQGGATTEDPSNIKRFWSPCDNGLELQVHRWDMGAKKMCIAVEIYELLKLTSTLGMQKLTVTGS